MFYHSIHPISVPLTVPPTLLLPYCLSSFATVTTSLLSVSVGQAAFCYILVCCMFLDFTYK